MNATITNYRGLSQATLDLSRICLLAAPNEGGKTSASQAVAAALTGDPIPIKGVKKTEAGLLVRSGTASGSVELTGENGKTLITWPNAKVKTEGQAPWASHFATGLLSIVTLDDKERVKTLTEYLKATPTREDLDKQLASMKLPETVLDQLWKLIETQGWDNAHTQIKEKGARLKGQWENTTADRYGVKKADSWIPVGYDNDLMGQSEDTLAAIVTDARDALEAAIATDAVDDSRRGDMEALAALLAGRKVDALAADNEKPLPVPPTDPAFQAQLDECNGFIRDLSAKRNVIEDELNELPSPAQTGAMPCPSCCTPLHLSSGSLVMAAVISDAEILSRRAKIDEVNSRFVSLTEAISSHMTSAARINQTIKSAETTRTTEASAAATVLMLKRTETRRLVKESEAAAEYLLKPAMPHSNISVDDCRTTLSRAETRQKAFTQKHEADRLHVAIGNNIELLAKISPEGIRGDVLARALKGFNDSLIPLCKAAAWRPVTLESDFLPCYGGTIYLLLSESAKFRVRTILQMGMALMDKSQALVIDAADILDKGGRNGLFKAVQVVNLPTLIAMTIDAKELVPNLAAAGLGVSYWINSDAVAEPVV